MDTPVSNELSERASSRVGTRHLTPLGRVLAGIRARVEAQSRRLESQGEPVDVCEVCRGRGWYIQDGFLTPCAGCRLDDEVSRREAYSQLSPVQRGQTFEAFSFDVPGDVVDAYEVAWGVAGGKSFPWLVMLGSKGWGKTHLATAIVNYRIEKPDLPAAKFVTVPDFLAELRSAYDTGTHESVIEVYRFAPMLVLDDLGAQYNRGGGGVSWAEEQIYRVLDYRYGRRLETVVTSNARMSDLDDRVADRLLDTRTGLVGIVNLIVPSYRSGQVLA